MDEHTQMNFRDEHYLPRISNRDTREAWAKAGQKEMIDQAREEAKKIIESHQPRELDSGLIQEIDQFVEKVARRKITDFEEAEWEE
jgi:trimethylamine:corrinoid methyltransferase-like protein